MYRKCYKLLSKLKKYLNIILLGLVLCTIITQNHCTNAITDSKKLLHDAYMARLEYSSDSESSRRLMSMIFILEAYNHISQDESTNLALNRRIEMIFDDWDELRTGKLCNPFTPEEIAARWPWFLVADFGESLLGTTI